MIGLGAHMMTKPLDMVRDWLGGRSDGIQEEAKDAEERVKAQAIKDAQSSRSA